MRLSLKGGTTFDEQATSDARTGNAPNQQDLQSAIAPQLTTTGADPRAQPEIPQSEGESTISLPFLDNWPANDEISVLVDHDPMLTNEVTETLEYFRRIVTSFIYLSESTSPKLTILKNLKLQKRNQQWIGLLLNP